MKLCCSIRTLVCVKYCRMLWIWWAPDEQVSTLHGCLCQQCMKSLWCGIRECGECYKAPSPFTNKYWLDKWWANSHVCSQEWQLPSLSIWLHNVNITHNEGRQQQKIAVLKHLSCFVLWISYTFEHLIASPCTVRVIYFNFQIFKHISMKYGMTSLNRYW